MLMKFNAQKMYDRLEREGRTNMIRPEDRDLIDKLNGRPATDNNWMHVVHGEPLAWIADDNFPDGGCFVNIADCD